MNKYYKIMVEYEIRQSENMLGRAFEKFMDRLSEHVTILARNGKPIASVMGIKRGLFRYRRVLAPDPSERFTPRHDPSALWAPPLKNSPPACGTPLKGGQADAHGLGMLVNEVMDKFDVDVSEAVEVGLVGENDIKKALAKYDYYQLVKTGVSGKDAKALLNKKYGFSVSMIEKLIYDKRKRQK